MGNKISVVDLFAGAGGLSEGFHQRGYDIVAYIEKEKNSCDTLLTRHIYWQLMAKNKRDIYLDYLNRKVYPGNALPPLMTTRIAAKIKEYFK